MLKFAMMLQAIDRVTGPAKRIRASMAGIGQGARKVASDIRSGARSFEFYETRARRLRQLALGRVFQAISEAAGKAARKVGDLVSRLKLAERATKGLKSAASGLFSKVGNTVSGMAKWGAAAATGGALFAMFDMFKTASDLEQVQSELEAVVGSQAKARAEMQWLRRQNLAVPLVELSQAYLELRRAGINPGIESLRAFTDEAAYSKKEIGEVVAAIKEAKGGDFGGLEAMKINASKKAGMVTFTWLDKHGKRVSKTVKDNAARVEKALTEVFRSRSEGAMERRGSTMAGMIGRLKNVWSDFMVRIADAGIFDKVKAGLNGLLDQIAKWAEDGTLEEWAKNISGWLSELYDKAVKFTKDGGWSDLKKNVESVGSAVMALVGAINFAAQAMGSLKDIHDGINEGNGPLDRSKRIGEKWYRRWNSGDAPQSVPNPPAPMSTSPKLSPPRQRIGAANDTKVGGLVRIQVEAKPGTSVRTAALQSDNRAVPLQIVNLGRVMAGAA